jgi:hypothetical protein
MDALDYERSLETRLRKLRPEYRRCFAVWCLNGTILKCKSLFERMKLEDVNLTLEIADTMYSNFIDGNISDESTDIITRRLTRLTDNVENQEDIANRNTSRLFFHNLISSMWDTVEVLKNGSLGNMIFLGMRILNCISIDLDERGETNLSGIEFLLCRDVRIEVEAQSRMLNYLETSPILDLSDVKRFK